MISVRKFFGKDIREDVKLDKFEINNASAKKIAEARKCYEKFWDRLHPSNQHLCLLGLGAVGDICFYVICFDTKGKHGHFPLIEQPVKP